MVLSDFLAPAGKKKSRGGGSVASVQNDKKEDKSDNTDDKHAMPERPANVPAQAVFNAHGFWAVVDGRKCRLCPRADSMDDPS